MMEDKNTGKITLEIVDGGVMASGKDICLDATGKLRLVHALFTSLTNDEEERQALLMLYMLASKTMADGATKVDLTSMIGLMGDENDE